MKFFDVIEKNEAEIAKRVAAKLAGEFYVGQRVRHAQVKDVVGTVMHFYAARNGEPAAMCTWSDSEPKGAFLKNLRAIES